MWCAVLGGVIVLLVVFIVWAALKLAKGTGIWQ